MGHNGSERPAPLGSPFHLQPTDLEAAISQAADDLKITAFGQRVRATLRRNRAAQGNAALPHASYKDVVGPDLVRELNALWFLAASDTPHVEAPTRLDRELFGLLQDHIDIARAIVARLWDSRLDDCAASFLDYDNVPVPLCPMYWNARDLIGNADSVFPRPLTQIVERLKTELAKSPLMQASLDHLDRVSPTYLQHLHAKKTRFIEESPCRRDETVADWADRLQALIQDARSEVPPALLALNQLIHVTVMCLVSLAVWDNRACPDDVSSCQPSVAEAASAAPDDIAPKPDVDRARSPDAVIPDSYELTVSATDLMFPPLDAAIRFYDGSRLRSIAVVKGASISGARGRIVDARLRIAPFASYETKPAGSS